MAEIFIIQVNTVERVHHMIQTAIGSFQGYQIGYRISNRISAEDYQIMANDIVLENINNQRSDFIMNSRSPPFDPLPTISIQNKAQFKAAEEQYGKEFIVRIAEGVAGSEKRQIVMAPGLAGVEVWNPF